MRDVSRDDIVQSDGVVLVDQLNFYGVNFLTEDEPVFFDLSHFVPGDVEKCNWHLASSVDIDFIFRDKRVVIDDAATVETLEDEFNTVVHGCVNFYHSVRDDLHDVRCFINLENL